MQFAKAGAHVTVADLQSDEGSQLAKELTAAGYQAIFVKCDVSDYSSCVNAFKHALNFSPHGALDIIVLMAGVVGLNISMVEQITKAGEANGGITMHSEPPKPKHTAIDINLVALYENIYLALYYLQVKPQINADTIPRTTKSLIVPASAISYHDNDVFTDYMTSKCKNFPSMETPPQIRPVLIAGATDQSWRSCLDPLTAHNNPATGHPFEWNSAVVCEDTAYGEHVSSL